MIIKKELTCIMSVSGMFKIISSEKTQKRQGKRSKPLHERNLYYNVSFDRDNHKCEIIRNFDRGKFDRYFERVKDLVDDIILKEVDVSLKDHRGHGSDKLKK